MATIPLRDALQRGIDAQKAGQTQQAEQIFRQLISQHPTNPDVLNLLGMTLSKTKRKREAADLFKMAVAVRDDIPEFHHNLASALHALRLWEPAEISARRTLQLNPEYVKGWSLLGAILSNLRRRDEARDCYQRALKIEPDDADAHTSLGVYYFDTGKYEEAIEQHRAALRLRPELAVAHLNLALALLLTGREEEGWEEYEWRSKCEGLPTHNFRQPLWDGSPLHGKRILLYTEQGLGDAIQFVRFAPVVKARGGRVSLICQKELKALLSTIDPAIEVVGRDERLPQFDLYAPLLSLPRIFKTRSNNIPADVPYLKADPNLAAPWNTKLANDPPGLRVGLAWAGSPSHRRDRERSISLFTLAPLLDVPGVTFYSLQKGPASQQINTLPPHHRLIDHTTDLKTMADTAAFIDNLDLLITVDTSVCHLAGALAKPVWVLIAAIPHWGWGLSGEATAWYPTMKLYRQEKADEWGPVIERIRAALKEQAAQRSS